jgi:hypothetical protein
MNIIPEVLVKSDLRANLTEEQYALFLGGIIAAAIQNGQLLDFTYDGKRRVVEAHALGKSTKDGSLVLRAYQVDGDSSRPVPGWSLFSVAKIETGTLRMSSVVASGAPRDGYKMGDKQMDPVLVELDTSVS